MCQEAKNKFIKIKILSNNILYKLIIKNYKLIKRTINLNIIN